MPQELEAAYHYNSANYTARSFNILEGYPSQIACLARGRRGARMGVWDAGQMRTARLKPETPEIKYTLRSTGLSPGALKRFRPSSTTRALRTSHGSKLGSRYATDPLA
jgi:hypothetical protein